MESIGVCEMIYRFAIEEVISSYYPILWILKGIRSNEDIPYEVS
jgi:hypothetical protein